MSTQRRIVLKRQWFITSKIGDIKDFYSIDRELGSGGFGKVYHGKEKSTGFSRAIKVIQKNKVAEHSAFLTEVSALRRLVTHIKDHPNVIKIIETIENEQFCYLIMEFCSGGELFDKIANKQHVSEADAIVIMRSLLRAVSYCHTQGVCHRDLKPDNCMFVDRSPDADIKLIDFGLAKQFTEAEVLHSINGTPFYIAPEMLTGGYNYMVDCWSLGVILYILLSGTPPFYGSSNQETLMRVYSGSFSFSPKPFRKVSDNAKDLISRLLVKDPSLRLNAVDALNHAWFHEVPHAPQSFLPKSMIEALTEFTRAQNLKRASLLFIASRLSHKDIDNLVPMFRGCDSDNDGFISEDELYRSLQSQNVDINEIQFQQLVQGLDANQNGKIDYTEFIGACIQNQSYLSYGMLKSAFEYFDLDNDGQITMEELQQSLRITDLTNDSPDLTSIIREADINRDGRIDYMEFLHMMVHDNVESHQ